GVVGDTIRLVVTYNRQDPESTFNLEIFRWAKNSAGARVKADREEWTALSMDRESPRYAKEFVNQNSKLVELDDKDETGSDFFDHSAVGSGHSQSGRGV
ncbi:MAG: hypothetical protein GTO45_30925, partial [Candidatus Aminicenantes bacterium]|nr:hypothetical protein [Candidatus Aminicenantes bacterium]NIN22582.1 hypothetical protein [Candidatus Aminicenantes bacterium]NIN89192.1 hypothetical protein [Candidatus Aminicenantes bacterium]NIO85689.1 hypothetical protein [Candidatus Aminicenantes bacterium]NIQ71585.1 hypothetical protein [Candidatus Aminicenantes bacterium]